MDMHRTGRPVSVKTEENQSAVVRLLLKAYGS
jgi:hypothetical protein